MSRYKVLIDDNFHFFNEDYPVVCSIPPMEPSRRKLIVDEGLEPMLQPGMTVTALYE